MSGTTPSALFLGVDQALFVAALSERLRRSGIEVSLGATTRTAASLGAVGPLTRSDLYWICRVSMLSRHEQIERFDAVFAALFDDPENALASRGRRIPPLRATHDDDRLQSLPVDASGEAESGAGLPWTTLPSASGVDDDVDDDDPLALPERLPAMTTAEADTPFDQLDDDDLARIGSTLETLAQRWPTRRSRRHRTAPRGSKPELRSTLRHALRTGGEPLTIHRRRTVHRPRRVVVLVDVSGSMETFARAYLHLTRALVIAGRAEVFAFATELTRITPSLRHRSAEVAIDRATADVGDRFGGTKVATSVGALLAHPRWSGLVRGSVVVIASDGWDTDPPQQLAAVMARLDRLAFRIVWVNPRSAAPDYQPLVGAMAAALPHCDAFVSGHSLAAMSDVLDAIVDA